MKKVLIVDDDAEVGLLLKAKLERGERFEVLLATEGIEAVHIAEQERPDVILCDIDMPEMDGVSVANTLEKKDATKRIPLIFLSSIVTPADVKRGVTAGDGRWPMLSKQSPLQELINSIETAAKK